MHDNEFLSISIVANNEIYFNSEACIGLIIKFLTNVNKSNNKPSTLVVSLTKFGILGGKSQA